MSELLLFILNHICILKCVCMYLCSDTDMYVLGLYADSRAAD